ncbi:MAG: AMP-binding protein [Microthrixaceae bacterium]
MQTYTDHRPTFVDRAEWTTPAVLRARAASHGDRVWLEVPSTGETYTFARTAELAERIASGLLARGHAPGDRVVVMMDNCSDYLFAWLGASVAGMAEVPINTAYKGSFFEHQVSTVAPSAAVVSVALVDRFLESRAACETIHHVYLTLGDDAELESAAERLRQAGYAAEPFAALRSAEVGPLPQVRSQDLASVFFTSGTTGLSKGVMMPHAHMFLFADETVSLTRLTDEDTYLSMGPLFHGNSQFLAAYPALIAGSRYVMRERFSASRWIDWVRESRATVTNFVGVMMDFVWKQSARPDDADNDLRCIFAAPTASYAPEFRERFGVEAFVEVFGLTETAMPIMSPYGVERPLGAAGLLVSDWFEIRLVDPETDEEVPTGELGELTVRPKAPFTTCAGYYAMPEKSLEAMRNCWFHTGDGLRQDADGWYYFVDRLKDAIRRRGENISSYEVEQAMLEHPAVAECAVVAVPADQEAGEDEVMVFVVAAEGQHIEATELWSFADHRLPYFAVPRYVSFVDALPKTPSEKVQKAKLRDLGLTDALDRVAVTGAMPGRS